MHAVPKVKLLQNGTTVIFNIALSIFWMFKALSHGAIFLATCNAILLLRDVDYSNRKYTVKKYHKSRIALQVSCKKNSTVVQCCQQYCSALLSLELARNQV